jgi:hypothetical protein
MKAISTGPIRPSHTTGSIACVPARKPGAAEERMLLGNPSDTVWTDRSMNVPIRMSGGSVSDIFNKAGMMR